MAIPTWVGPVLTALARVANGVMDAINRKNKAVDPATKLGGDNGVHESDKSFDDIVSSKSDSNPPK